jgi:hypothetical protein
MDRYSGTIPEKWCGQARAVKDTNVAARLVAPVLFRERPNRHFQVNPVGTVSTSDPGRNLVIRTAERIGMIEHRPSAATKAAAGEIKVDPHGPYLALDKNRITGALADPHVSIRLRVS